MERMVSLVLLAACGGSVELGAPNAPPEWPMGSVVAHPPAPTPASDATPADTDVPSGPQPSAEPAPPVTEPAAPAPEMPPVEEPPETE